MNKKSNTRYKGKKPPIKKMENIKVKCDYVNEEAKGVVKYENKTIHIPYLLKGEEATLHVKHQGRHFNTKILSISNESKDRVVPKCDYYYECGGCQMQHISDEAQGHYKENTVRTVMKPFGKVEKIITMKDPYQYRNKVQASFGTVNGSEIISGFYKEYTHEITPIEQCIIQDPKADAILKTIRAIVKRSKIRIYNEDTENGFLRHVLIRTGQKSGQIMVVFVVADKIFPSKSKVVKSLVDQHPEITTIVMNINKKTTSAVLGYKEQVLYGKGVIEDTLCDLKFQISPRSFYQINPVQTEKLYNKAIEFADLKGDEVVLDAYSGIGTISLLASQYAKEVVGIELNKDAVKNAIVNAKINHIKNARFYEADAGEFMVELAKDKYKIDLVFMDPPRSGSDEKFLSSLVKLAPKKVVYVSCNPVTQAIDLEYLTKRGYKVEKIQPVDMFPQTYHVETVVSLKRT